VAQGVYKPAATIDPSISFDLPNGVALYGGFAGIETTLDQRDWRANLTILSGDIDNNDIAPSGVVTNTANIVGANSYHVVAGRGITNSTVLDGFTITAGQANGSFPEDSGAGFYCDGAGDGNECSPTLANITFVGNWAGLYAGAMFNNGTVGGNSSPNLTNIIFAGNTAGFGGAMFNDGAVDGNSSPTLINVVFSGNVASGNGGAMLNDGWRGGSSNPTFINVTFSGNTAASHGGAIVSYSTEGGSSNPVLTNVILWGNSASDSGDVMYNENAMPTIAYSLVEGGLDGSGGLSGRQLFAQGSRKGWYLKPRLATAVDHVGAVIIPCDVWSDEQKRAVDEVYAAVVVENKQWLLLGAGEELAQVEAMVAHYLKR
jgi:predicted outer membrane repeat protein